MLDFPEFLSPVERKVLELMIEGTELFREELKSQITTSHLLKHEFNGYGFFTHFGTEASVPVLPWQDYRINAQAKIGGELCGFLLWFKAGKIDFLEGYPLGGDAWPESQTVTDLKLN